MVGLSRIQELTIVWNNYLLKSFVTSDSEDTENGGGEINDDQEPNLAEVNNQVLFVTINYG